MIRRSEERGHVEMGWLDSRHTFSFGGYYDPRFMGFGKLRVINEDHVEPGKGFHPHGHRNMEIVSYVVGGSLAHEDSTGKSGVIRPGDVQVMTAGRGIQHSEMNGSENEPVHFLQIWIEPGNHETDPGYRQRHFEKKDGVTLLVSPDGRDESLTIDQDVDIHRILLQAGATAEFVPTRKRSWVQVVSGTLEVNGTALSAGDAVGLDAEPLSFRADSAVEALVFDLT